MDGATLRPLTHVNYAFFAEVRVGTTEDVNFRNKDGLTVGALLVKPANFQPGTRYPLLLQTGLRERAYHHSRFRDQAWARAISPDPVLRMHPDTALAQGLAA